MKKIITSILTVLLAATIASAVLVRYHQAATSKPVYLKINQATGATEWHEAEVELEVPTEATQGSDVSFSGTLVDKETRAPITGRGIWVRWNSIYDAGIMLTTDSEGKFSGSRPTVDEYESRDIELRIEANFWGD